MFRLTSSSLTMPPYFPNTVIMQDPTNPLPSIVLPGNTSIDTHTTPPGVLNTHDPLSPQDKYELYAVLQDIAKELRRIKREQKRQKH